MDFLKNDDINITHKYVKIYKEIHLIVEASCQQFSYPDILTFKKSFKIPKGNQNSSIEEQTTQWPKEKEIEGDQNRRYPQDFTSIEMENLNCTFNKIK